MLMGLIWWLTCCCAMQLGRCLGALLVKGAVSPTGALSAVLEASGEGFDDEPGERLIEGPNANSLLKALFGEWRAGSGQEAVQIAWQSKLSSLVNKEVCPPCPHDLALACLPMAQRCCNVVPAALLH